MPSVSSQVDCFTLGDMRWAVTQAKNMSQPGQVWTVWTYFCIGMWAFQCTPELLRVQRFLAFLVLLVWTRLHTLEPRSSSGLDSNFCKETVVFCSQYAPSLENGYGVFYADGISQILPVLSTKIQMRRTLRIRVSEEAWQVRISCIHVQRTWNCISQAQCHRQACFYHRHF